MTISNDWGWTKSWKRKSNFNVIKETDDCL